MANSEIPAGEAVLPATDPAGGAAVETPSAPLATEAAPAAPSLLEAAKADESTTTAQEPVLAEVKEPEAEAPKTAQEPDKAAAPAEVTPEAEAAPEPVPVYSDFTFPEGFTPDKEVVSKVTEILSAHRAPQELGQSLIDLHLSEMEKVGEAQRTSWDSLQRSWQDQVKGDPDIGGDALPGVLSSAARVLDTYGAEGVREILTLTGAGNHPALIKTFNNLAKALKEGSAVPATSGPAPKPTSRAQRLYGKGS